MWSNRKLPIWTEFNGRNVNSRLSQKFSTELTTNLFTKTLRLAQEHKFGYGVTECPCMIAGA
jgi:hypothetical protein